MTQAVSGAVLAPATQLAVQLRQEATAELVHVDALMDEQCAAES